MSDKLLSQRWDAEYETGKYAHEPPVNFVNTILSTLERFPEIKNGRGLYVGCGNGRNYLPLIRTGLNLYGLDASKIALKQLSEQEPSFGNKLFCEDFRSFDADSLFDYLIAIQVFQHGGQKDIEQYFTKAASLLKPQGLFFLRVNSISTQIKFQHNILERNDLGGFTIQYLEGPKRDLPIHFYSRDELLSMTRNDFSLIVEPIQQIIPREPPKKGNWAQWEVVFKKNPS
ncbi:MAG TPA: methyltransferase domain-containing protein [Candidatus Nanoarchaeia archaeon]|nr:methyltransferase domain-containing protein [Candidatus Nanoarchaeia archaeon]